MQRQARHITESNVNRQACFAIKINSIKQCAKACYKVSEFLKADHNAGNLHHDQVCVLSRCLQAHEC